MAPPPSRSRKSQNGYSRSIFDEFGRVLVGYTWLVKDSRQGDVSNFDILIRPFVEELDAANLLCYFFGQDHIPARIVNLDFSGVRHAGQNQSVLCGIVVVLCPGLSNSISSVPLLVWALGVT